MLISHGQRVPTRVASRFGPAEVSVASLHGFLGSGFALTERRLFAWREGGSVAPVPLAGIERILVGEGSDNLIVVVQPLAGRVEWLPLGPIENRDDRDLCDLCAEPARRPIEVLAWDLGRQEGQAPSSGDGS